MYKALQVEFISKTNANYASNNGMYIKRDNRRIKRTVFIQLLCSVCKKICVHTYRFRIVFARPHYNAVSILKTLLYPQCACSNELDACALPFSDSIVFSVHTTKQRFQNGIVFKSLHSGGRFRMAPFSVIVFGVAVWTIAVSGAKQLHFRLKTD